MSDQEINNLLLALENESNSSIMNMTTSKIKTIKNNMLQKLGLNREELKNLQIVKIIHLAAHLIIGEGQKKPKKYFKNNVLGTQKILDACKKTTVKNFIFSSTAAIYREGQYKVSENSLIKPKSVYGKTKIKAENLIKSFAKNNKISELATPG